ncbi:MULTISPECIES: hypothetical protein [Pseudomonas]|uniref:Uncharacterized protein n=1 Tax=Pseudomonas fluorescens TaxID=294 RepID=A0A161XFZ5_PSEFL|nr:MULTISPECIES: hypothetical protein [Pseudomonas]KZN20748.1 hypothetical protein A1D17_04175 [Pseudomonas fluorescens]
MSTFIKMPPEKLLESVKLADTYPMDAARLLCDWWNQESGCAPELRCAAIPLLWASKDEGSTFSAVHYYGPCERSDLFTQPAWSSSVASCSDSVIVVFLREPTVSDLDRQGFFHTYLVNQTEYESLGIDYEDYQPGASEQFSQITVKYPREYRALLDLPPAYREGATS